MPEAAPASIWTPEIIISVISVFIALAAAIFAGWTPVGNWWTRRILARGFGSEQFGQETIDRSTRYYVEPDCSSVDPAGEAEIRGVLATKEKVFTMLDQFLDKASRYQHLILLADSGMGKTSCLLNYYARNHRKPWGRHRIALTPLRNDPDSYIASIDRKQDTVMFLDAFDEDPDAVADHGKRLGELMELYQDFRRVVITSRTQFFPKDEEIPMRTGILRRAPTELGQSAEYERGSSTRHR